MPVTTSQNPNRVAAARLNRQKWKGFTPEGLEKLRQTALKNKPWQFSTGPRTKAGKAKVALNGKKRQLGPRSVREVRADMQELRDLVREMQESRGCLE
jgi:hypothetical protein